MAQLSTGSSRSPSPQSSPLEATTVSGKFQIHNSLSWNFEKVLRFKPQRKDVPCRNYCVRVSIFQGIHEIKVKPTFDFTQYEVSIRYYSKLYASKERRLALTIVHHMYI